VKQDSSSASQASKSNTLSSSKQTNLVATLEKVRLCELVFAQVLSIVRTALTSSS